VTRTARLAVASVLIGIAAFGAAFFVINIANHSAGAEGNPQYIDYAAGHSTGSAINMTIQTNGATGFGPEAPSVTYMAKTPGGKWEESTLWEFPAHTRVNVTAYEYDTGDPFRNEFFGGVSGIIGDKISVRELSGKTETVSVMDSNTFPYVGHSFTVPQLGIDVPFQGLSPLTPLSHLCPASACTTNYYHTITKFSFMTPGPGLYNWQCEIPCGFSYFDGQGGPMATVGHMTGFLKVVSA
jgi:hypothetical protein